MRRPKKLLLGCATLAVVSFVAAAIAIPLLVDVNALRPQAERRLGAMLGRKVTLGPARISIFTGLALRSESLRIGEPLAGSAAGVPIVEAGTTAVRLAFLPLLRKEIDARSIAIDDAKVLQDGKPSLSELKERSSMRVAADGALAAAGTADMRVEMFGAKPRMAARFDVGVSKGTLDVRSSDAEVAGAKVSAAGRVEGISTPQPVAQLDVKVALGKSTIAGPLHVVLGSATPDARFDLKASTLDLAELAVFPSKLAGTPPPAVPAGVELHDVAAAMTFREGEVRLDDATYRAFGGRGRGTVAAHPFDAARGFTVDQKIEGVAIAALIAAFAPAQKGSVEGTAALDVGLSGRAGAPALLPTLNGRGRLDVRNGSIKSAGMIAQVMKLLEVAGAKGFAKPDTPFDTLTADFAVSSGVASTKNLAFRSADIDFDGEGTIGLGGALKLEALASFSKEVTEQLVAKTQALAMRVNDAGRLTVPLQIRGTVQAPKVQLDVDKVIREGLTRELKKKGTKDLLKKLFGRNG